MFVFSFNLILNVQDSEWLGVVGNLKVKKGRTLNQNEFLEIKSVFLFPTFIIVMAP